MYNIPILLWSIALPAIGPNPAIVSLNPAGLDNTDYYVTEVVFRNIPDATQFNGVWVQIGENPSGPGVASVLSADIPSPPTEYAGKLAGYPVMVASLGPYSGGNPAYMEIGSLQNYTPRGQIYMDVWGYALQPK